MDKQDKQRLAKYWAWMLPTCGLALLFLRCKRRITIYDIPDEQIPELAYSFGLACYVVEQQQKEKL